MTHLVVVEARNLIQSGDIVRAEALLSALVETEGDYALVEVLDEMPSKDLLAVIREYDSSKQSLLNLLITPEQFARVVVLDRLYKDMSHEHLRGMINSVIFREDADANEFIAAIAELEFGYEALADYLSDRAEEVAGETFAALETEDITRAEISDHDWKELTWLLRHEHADIYNIVHALLKVKLEEKSIPEVVHITEGDEEVVVNNDPVEKVTRGDDEDEDSAI
ncbi:hypothetical protein [Methylotenera sp.]|uniref:hypothetical protein n=1 Tax=Methylotenera sp. TaxID=2051956 RepID=UPI00271CACE0|nr:hypothetical protein [Methylotenera sp.]MDO9204422.1 hypothetical protein [Methylotenera sp.]MDP1521973.1 hypothetical protein [Methylotenera sp.]MDP2072193.1 hypothetical protein [Methylotenera sp.]MDP3006796.1 hypothetical protein [Methylotenera sp.]MDP3007267.1 hypothetical protein [Methylotenera sp.]